MHSSTPTIVQLFLSFLRLGVTAFGGPAMIVHLRKLAVEKNRWLDVESFNAAVALCQTIPGATVMQAAAYVGLRVRGVSGAISSFVGFGLPAFLTMTVLSVLYVRMHDLPVVVSAFVGLQAIIVGIVAHAALSFGKTALKEWKHTLIAGPAAVLFALHVSPILVIVLAALAGLLLRNTTQAAPRSVAMPLRNHSTKTHLLLMIVIVAGFFLLLFLLRRDFFDLAVLMSKIDLFAFGGGFASIPLMLHEIVDVRHWMDTRTFMHGIILGQLTPGPIVITATFVGYILYGIPGGIVATVGVFLPSFLILVGITPYFERLRSSPYFNKAIHGILCSFVGLLISVVGYFSANVHWDAMRLILFTATFIALYLKVDILWVVLVGTAISVLL
jgi:chromate transporter